MGLRVVETCANRVLPEPRIELRPGAVVVFPNRAFIYRRKVSRQILATRPTGWGKEGIVLSVRGHQRN